MQKKIKITAIRKADYKDLQQKYENPKYEQKKTAAKSKLCDGQSHCNSGHQNG